MPNDSVTKSKIQIIREMQRSSADIMIEWLDAMIAGRPHDAPAVQSIPFSDYLRGKDSWSILSSPSWDMSNFFYRKHPEVESGDK